MVFFGWLEAGLFSLLKANSLQGCLKIRVWWLSLSATSQVHLLAGVAQDGPGASISETSGHLWPSHLQVNPPDFLMGPGRSVPLAAGQPG